MEIDNVVDIKEERKGPSTPIKLENDEASSVNLENFVREAKLLDPDLLSASLGPILNPKQSLWDVLASKMT